MIVLNRENIIEGLMEMKKEEEFESKFILNNIEEIVVSADIDDLEKLKLINNELGKLLLA